jgi:hypothetical protein
VNAEFPQLSRRILAVMRRCSTPTAVLAAAFALAMGAGTGLAQADAINPNASTALANYRLTVSGGLATPDADIDGPQVVAMVVPAGGVVPPTNADGTQGSPLTVLGDSSGFDAGQLVVALKDATNSSGEPEQLLGLVFFGQGLSADGVLHFSLSVDSSLASNPPQLLSSTPGVTITADPLSSPPDGPGGSDAPPENVPEPVAVLLWSAAAGAVALRARRTRPAAPRCA